MKKLLGAALAAALVLPSGPASAEILKNLNVSGQLDIQSNSGRNIDDFRTTANDRLGTTLSRVLFNVGWDLLDDVHAMATLRKNDRPWGSNGGQGQGTDGNSQALLSGGGTGVANNVFVQQAYVKIDKLFGGLDTTLGRQYFGDPGDLVIYFGPRNNYGLQVTAVDGVRFDHACDMMTLTGLAARTSAIPTTLAGTVADVDIRGLQAGIKNLPVMLTPYVWNQVTHRTGALGSNAGKNDFLWIYGVKMKAEAMGGWLKAEIAHNSGENRTAAGSANYKGSAFMADLGYKAEVANVAAFTPWAHFGWGSGTGDTVNPDGRGFTAIAPDYRPGIIYGRFDGAVANGLGNALTGGTVSSQGITNRVIYGAGLKANPAAVEKLTLGASIWDYRLQKNVTGSGTPSAGTTASRGNRHLGYELGLTADWKHSDNVSVGAGYANFQPGGYVKNNNRVAVVGTEPIQFVFADFSVRF